MADYKEKIDEWQKTVRRKARELDEKFALSDLVGEGSRAAGNAAKRGARLLEENLSAAQRQQYSKYRYFDVVGGRSGKRYRIHHGSSMNIDQLDKNGKRMCGWCFFPRGGLVAGDVMLAQKFALELFEGEALQVANRLYRY